MTQIRAAYLAAARSATELVAHPAGPPAQMGRLVNRPGRLRRQPADGADRALRRPSRQRRDSDSGISARSHRHGGGSAHPASRPATRPPPRPARPVPVRTRPREHRRYLTRKRAPAGAAHEESLPHSMSSATTHLPASTYASHPSCSPPPEPVIPNELVASRFPCHGSPGVVRRPGGRSAILDFAKLGIRCGISFFSTAQHQTQSPMKTSCRSGSSSAT
jgi:hypothetical protein